MQVKKILTGGSLAAVVLSLAAAPAMAATTVVVTPADTQGWYSADTRPGGAIAYVADATSPLPDAALQLTTDETNAAKAQYLRDELLPLSEVTELGYATKQNAGPIHAAASYQLVADLNGAADGGFTTFVYEPYQNGVVAPSVWQNWDVDAGQMWSSRSFTEGTCTVAAGAGGAPFYTLAALQAACPDAVVLAFGVNVGSFNPGYDVEVDAVSFNETTYDFELLYVNEPTSKDDCKKDGYKTLTDADGNAFKNQGQCVSYFNHMN